MGQEQSGLVDIARDLLSAYQLTRRLTERYRNGELCFEELKTLVGDSESSLLFRLKERCHALFRPAEGSPGETVRPEALFDLAVGSLFHEAMKLRENFYQHEVYGPKVRALRAAVDAGADDAVRENLVREMEKILDAAAQRLDEAVHETDTLLTQTRDQFRILVAEHRDNGLVCRYLVEHASLVGEVFEEGLDSLLREIYGSPAEGYALAARSYLSSGFFEEGRRALDEALGVADARADLERLCIYAEGMSAYLNGNYARSVERLGRWLDAEPGEAEAPYADLAYAAVSRVGQLVEGRDSAAIAKASAKLAQRIKPYSPRARDG
jgi:tetratricopeptide (TPR) repeat protein